MTAPVALQILTTMKIIMGEDGTNEGVCVCVRVLLLFISFFRSKTCCSTKGEHKV